MRGLKLILGQGKHRRMVTITAAPDGGAQTCIFNGKTFVDRTTDPDIPRAEHHLPRFLLTHGFTEDDIVSSELRD